MFLFCALCSTPVHITQANSILTLPNLTKAPAYRHSCAPHACGPGMGSGRHVCGEKHFCSWTTALSKGMDHWKQGHKGGKELQYLRGCPVELFARHLSATAMLQLLHALSRQHRGHRPFPIA